MAAATSAGTTPRAGVLQRRRSFHQGEPADERPLYALAGDREVLDGALGLCLPLGQGRHLYFAHGIVLGPVTAVGGRAGRGHGTFGTGHWPANYLHGPPPGTCAGGVQGDGRTPWPIRSGSRHWLRVFNCTALPVASTIWAPPT